MGKIPLSKLKDAALEGRSDLYRGMLEHASEMAIVVAQGRPNWAALAKRFGAAGYFDATGKHPSAEVTRQTWRKVQKALEGKPKPNVVVVDPISRVPSKPAAPQPPDDDEPEFFTISGAPVGKR